MEEFNYECDFKLYSNSIGNIVEHTNFLGIKFPIIGKEHMQNLKNWMSKNTFQRDQKLLVTKVSNEETCWVYDAGIADDSSVLRHLLINGWVRLT